MLAVTEAVAVDNGALEVPSNPMTNGAGAVVGAVIEAEGVVVEAEPAVRAAGTLKCTSKSHSMQFVCMHWQCQGLLLEAYEAQLLEPLFACGSHLCTTS